MPHNKFDVSDYIGKKFNKLTITGDAGVRSSATHVFAKCVCGNEKSFRLRAILSGNTMTCGCLRKPHGLTKTREWNSYSSMKSRCLNPNAPNYSLYGGRGVTICKRWLEPKGQGFINFLEDIGPRPVDFTLDKDVRGGVGCKIYSPDTCSWQPANTQSQNTRNTKLDMEKATQIRKLYAEGTKQKDLAESFGVDASNISNVVNNKTWR